jgi:hypothetical protein
MVGTPSLLAVVSTLQAISPRLATSSLWMGSRLAEVLICSMRGGAACEEAMGELGRGSTLRRRPAQSHLCAAVGLCMERMGSWEVEEARAACAQRQGPQAAG